MSTVNNGGSYEIKNGKRVVTQQTLPQKTLSHDEKIAAANGKHDAQQSQTKTPKSKKG